MRKGAFHLSCLLACLVGAAIQTLAEEEFVSGAGVEFFERKIRPLFAENCYSCHGEEKQKGGLRLDRIEGIRTGGESGDLYLAGNPDGSRIVRAVRYEDPDLKMPPKTRLSERQVKDLVQWIAAGAALPENPAKNPFPANRRPDAAQPHWAFQRVIKPEPPAGSESPVDGFIGRELAANGLTPNPPASRRELIRRATFDLLGLPPTPEEVAEFELDGSPNALEKVIERLLASPRYGERWGRHWLDLVRFAQSNGYERDGEKLLAWRYRDYVIDAFNADKPYNRFVMEQIAGDELDEGSADSVAATAFQRLGVFDDEPDDKRTAEFDALDDILSTTGSTFLGLTIGCARCHDHKFDPIPQADYYSLLAFFRGVLPFESGAPSFDSPGFAPLGPPREVRQWRAGQNERIRSLQEQIASAEPERKKDLEAQMTKVRQEAPYAWTLAVRERGPTPPATHILTRGNASSPAAEVKPGLPRALTSCEPNLAKPEPAAISSGRRRALAEWIASADNPLTARVMVNRIWRHHFGEGLVATTSDFGRAGTAPSHPALLDWLAAEFIEQGWSMKKMHRLIMMSAAYQQSSQTGNGRALAIDPGNRLLWRQNLRRLEAEAIRDTLLAISGNLNLEMGGRGFFPHLGGEVLAGQSRPGLDWDNSPRDERSRRSVYAYVRRTMGVPLFETFDYNNTTSPLSERPSTTVAPQALMLLNDRFMQEQAEGFVTRLLRLAKGDSEKQIRTAYRMAFSRAPSESELRTSLDFLVRTRESFAGLPPQIRFQLDVPNALSTDYFSTLASEEFLLGPRSGWRYYRGDWEPPYEGIRVARKDSAPFGLWEGARIHDGKIEATVHFSPSSEFASLIVRGKAENDSLRGLEVVLDVREQHILLKRHREKIETMAEAEAMLSSAKPVQLRIEMNGPEVRVWLGQDSRPALEAQVGTAGTEPGMIGVRVWGGPLRLEGVRVSNSATSERYEVPSDRPAPEIQALRAYSLMLLNLNELIYVD